MYRPLIAIGFTLGVAGCGSASETPADARPFADGADRPPGDPLGRVDIQQFALGTYTGSLVTATFSEVATPRWQRQTMQMGVCSLWQFTPGNCSGSPFCDGVCVDTTCQPWPTFRPAGKLTISLLERPLEPAENGAYYWWGQAELFDPGELVTVTAAGASGGFPGFSAQARGVSPVTVPLNASGQLVIEDSTNKVVSWTPAGDGSEVVVTLNSKSAGGHGQPLEAIIECVAPDATGQLTIPSPIITAFPPHEGADICVRVDCPPSSIKRRSRAVADVTGGFVELEVSSEFRFMVKH